MAPKYTILSLVRERRLCSRYLPVTREHKNMSEDSATQFDGHPCTLYLHEPDSAVPMTEVPLIAARLAAELDPAELRGALARTMSIRVTRVAGSLPQFKKAYRKPVR